MGACTTKVPKSKQHQSSSGNGHSSVEKAEQNEDIQIQTSRKDGAMESSNTALVPGLSLKADASKKNYNGQSTNNNEVNQQSFQPKLSGSSKQIQNPNSYNGQPKEDETELNEALSPSKQNNRLQQLKNRQTAEDSTQKESEVGTEIQQTKKKQLCFEESDQDSGEEEEKKGAMTKGKHTRMSILDQQSTAHTGLMNDGFSKKEDYQTSETGTATHKIVKAKKSALISTHESGIMIKVHCPTQESVLEDLEGEDELKEIPDEPENDEREDQENLSDENMESVVQKNYYLEKAGEGFMQKNILNLDQRNPCDRASQNSSGLIISMTAVCQ